MMVLVTYDVTTIDTAGRRRLRKVAKACRNYGQRVQLSVFEIEVEPAQWTLLKQMLLELIDAAQDSLRFYYLGANWTRRVEHIGVKPATDFNGPLIF